MKKLKALALQFKKIGTEYRKLNEESRKIIAEFDAADKLAEKALKRAKAARRDRPK